MRPALRVRPGARLACWCPVPNQCAPWTAGAPGAALAPGRAPPHQGPPAHQSPQRYKRTHKCQALALELQAHGARHAGAGSPKSENMCGKVTYVVGCGDLPTSVLVAPKPAGATRTLTLPSQAIRAGRTPDKAKGRSRCRACASQPAVQAPPECHTNLCMPAARRTPATKRA